MQQTIKPDLTEWILVVESRTEMVSAVARKDLSEVDRYGEPASNSQCFTLFTRDSCAENDHSWTSTSVLGYTPDSLEESHTAYNRYNSYHRERFEIHTVQAPESLKEADDRLEALSPFSPV